MAPPGAMQAATSMGGQEHSRIENGFKIAFVYLCSQPSTQDAHQELLRTISAPETQIQTVRVGASCVGSMDDGAPDEAVHHNNACPALACGLYHSLQLCTALGIEAVVIHNLSEAHKQGVTSTTTRFSR